MMRELVAGDLIEVSMDEDFEDSHEKEFVGMTPKGKYMCWSYDKEGPSVWDYARDTKKTKTIELWRWEKVIETESGCRLMITDLMDASYADKYVGKEEGWIKLESSKITREVEI